MPIRKSDIAIIHVGCASAAGYQLTRQLRSADARMGILLLAATHESATVRITGLERGAASRSVAAPARTAQRLPRCHAAAGHAAGVATGCERTHAARATA
jgi:DNA-binding response OmpR family regulator